MRDGKNLDPSSRTRRPLFRSPFDTFDDGAPTGRPILINMRLQRTSYGTRLRASALNPEAELVSELFSENVYMQIHRPGAACFSALH